MKKVIYLNGRLDCAFSVGPAIVLSSEWAGVQEQPAESYLKKGMEQ